MDRSPEFLLDYFNATIWVDVDRLKYLVEFHLLQGSAFEDQFVWEFHPMPGKMWSGRHTYAGGDVTIMVSRQPWVMLQMRGSACGVLQNTLPHLFHVLANEVDEYGVRLNVTRIDPCWNYWPLAPREMFERIQLDEKTRRPEVVTPIRGNAEWLSNDEGQTCAFPAYKRGENPGKLFRCYNRRGYNRMELQLRDDEANGLFRRLLEHRRADWAEASVPHLLRLIDFRDVGLKDTSARPRCEWWQGVVGDAKKSVPSAASPPSSGH